MIFLIKKLILLFFKRPKHWRSFIYVEIGAYFINKGAGYQVGQLFVIPIKNKGKTIRKKVYVKNLYHNFKDSNTTHTFSDHPIPELTEKFEALEKSR